MIARPWSRVNPEAAAVDAVDSHPARGYASQCWSSGGGMGLEELADEDLAERYYSCDGAAFGELYQRYYRWLAAWFGLHLPDQDACDLAEETFIKFLLTKYKDKGKFDRSRGAFKPWIFSIARNVLIDYLRRQGRLPLGQFEQDESQPSGMERIPDARLCAEDELIRDSFCKTVKNCIGQLDPVLAFVLLSRLNRATLSEIATQIDVSVPTVQRYWDQAARQLRLCLETYGYAFIPKGAEEHLRDIVAELESEVVIRRPSASKGGLS